MTYLGRPVFPFAPNWSDTPSGDWEFDPRELQIGFGAEITDPAQAHVIRGYRFSLDLRNDEITALDAFLVGLRGRAEPFWLPAPRVAMVISGGVGATQFDIRYQGLHGTWIDNPAAFLWLTKTGETPQIGKIVATADNGNGTERVTLAASLATPVDDTWEVSRLHLVRLADDTDDIELLSEGHERRTITVVERPNDYTAAAAEGLAPASRPIYLYRFWLQLGVSAVEWFYTSHPSAIISSGQEHTPAPLIHGSIGRSVRAESEGTAITGDYDTIAPLQQLVRRALARPLQLQISETTEDDPDTAVIIFSGRVLEPQLKGRKVTARARSWSDMLNQPVPAQMIMRRCNYHVYQPDTCRVARALHELEVTITAIAARLITITGDGLADMPEDWLAEGWIETGELGTTEERQILTSAAAIGNDVLLTINTPLLHAEIDQSAVVVPGCDGLYATCSDKFDNRVNFGGYPQVRRNLSIEALPVPQSAGGKK
jgi:uncharacterized phage protein (TIGR02218 family)